MKLTRLERLILANQYRILGHFEPENANESQGFCRALESGYEAEFERIATGIDADILNAEECHRVVDVMSMYLALQSAYTRLDDTTGIDPGLTAFPGYDGNEEGSRAAYARYCQGQGERFKGLKSWTEDFDSHYSMRAKYARMLEAWEASEQKYQLTKDDVVRILAAGERG
jgi:uncharacterized protein